MSNTSICIRLFSNQWRLQFIHFIALRPPLWQAGCRKTLMRMISQSIAALL